MSHEVDARIEAPRAGRSLQSRTVQVVRWCVVAVLVATVTGGLVLQPRSAEQRGLTSALERNDVAAYAVTTT